jgi:hypothetical protein
MTRLRTGWLSAQKGFFLFTIASRPVLGPTQPPIQWVPGVQRTGRESDHSPPSSAEVKNALSYTSAPAIRLHGVVLSWKRSTRATLPFTAVQPITCRHTNFMGQVAMIRKLQPSQKAISCSPHVTVFLFLKEDALLQVPGFAKIYAIKF